MMRADESGRVVLEEGDHGPMDVTAAGYLLRESRLGGDSDATLWPVDADYPAEYVRALLYTPAYLTREKAPDTVTAMVRIVARRVSIVPSAELARDGAALRAHHEGAAAVTEATEGAIVFAVESRPGAGVVFHTALDPAASADALTYRDLRGGAVTGGRTVFASLSAARDPGFLAHELGHALGLQHSTVPADVMYFRCGGRSSYSFTAHERRTIRLLLQRKPGNQFPDNDRATGLGMSMGTGGVTSVH
jgi:hypothetical protein